MSYIDDACRTKAGNLHTDLVPAMLFLSELRHVLDEASLLDPFKKGLFYGKDSDMLRSLRSNMQGSMAETYQIVPHDVLHGILGATTESLELLELLHTALVEEEDIPREKLIDECGDLLWYLAIIFSRIGVEFEEVMAANIAKLRKRFPEKFEKKLAINPNKAAETEEILKVIQ